MSWSRTWQVVSRLSPAKSLSATTSPFRCARAFERSSKATNVSSGPYATNVFGVNLLLYYCFTTALLLLYYCCTTGAAVAVEGAAASPNHTAFLPLYYCFTTVVLQVRQLLMKARLQDQIILMSGIQIDDSIIDEASMALATGNLRTSTPIRHKA